MKTNASPRTIIKAVETVSKEKYDGNVVFMKYPEKITKTVSRFTLRTKDANKPGSMVTKAGQKQPKVSWDVQQDVMDEILKLNPQPNIYVDTVYGRKFSEALEASEELVAQTENVVRKSKEEGSDQSTDQPKEQPHQTVAVEQPRVKRKYQRRAVKHTPAEKPVKLTTNNVVRALRHLIKHPELFLSK